MLSIEQETFVCFDCEATGLDPKKDRIIEIAVVQFTFTKILSKKEDLVYPECTIPEESIAIHHITNKMVTDKPTINAILPSYLELIDNHVIVGHSIPFDLALIHEEALRAGITSTVPHLTFIDTLRMARIYGESPTNSLDVLATHFNIPSNGAHRAMNDVLVNIEVFKQLAKPFKNTKAILKRLAKPILLKKMPLGKHKGRLFRDIPIEYLRWAAHQQFDQDLLFSIRTELKKRRQGNLFQQAANPFSSLE